MCGRKGVRRTAQGNWQAYITFKRKSICLGTYGDIDAASDAYLKKARELYGEFARTA
jgi:hypothetical protein